MTSYRSGKWKFIEGNTYDNNWWDEPTGEWWLPDCRDKHMLVWVNYYLDVVERILDMFMSRDRTWLIGEVIRKSGGALSNLWHGTAKITPGQPILATAWHDTGSTQLFDIESDPYEEHDVASDHPDVVARLRAEVAGLTADLEVKSWEDFL